MNYAATAKTDEEKPGLLKLLVDNCLKNPYVWLFAIAYFFVYVVRQGVTSWFIFYLKVSKSEALPEPFSSFIPIPYKVLELSMRYLQLTRTGAFAGPVYPYDSVDINSWHVTHL